MDTFEKLSLKTFFVHQGRMIVCGQCNKVIAINPLDFRSDWRCEDKKCSFRETAQQYITRNEALRAEIGQLSGSNSPDQYESLLGKFHSTPTLHPWNTNVLQVKYALTQLYGGMGSTGIKLQDLSEKQLQRKVELCSDLLEVANRLAPGLSPLRSKLLETLREALQELKNISGKSFDSAPAFVVQHLVASRKSPHHNDSSVKTQAPTLKQQLERVEEEFSRMMKSDPTLLRKPSKQVV